MAKGAAAAPLFSKAILQKQFGKKVFEEEEAEIAVSLGSPQHPHCTCHAQTHTRARTHAAQAHARVERRPQLRVSSIYTSRVKPVKPVKPVKLLGGGMPHVPGEATHTPLLV